MSVIHAKPVATALPRTTETTVTLHSAAAVRRVPIAIGVCWPRSVLTDNCTLQLRGCDGQDVPMQSTPLNRWPDGSLRWALLDFVAEEVPAGVSSWDLNCVPKLGLETHSQEAPLHERHRKQSFSKAHSQEDFKNESAVEIGKGKTSIHVRFTESAPPCELRFPFVDHRGRKLQSSLASMSWEACGPVRWTVVVSGRVAKCALNFQLRLSLYPHTGLARLAVRLHNPRRARHRGGLWDLGDRGSVMFQSFGVEITTSNATEAMQCRLEAGRVLEFSNAGPLHLHQEASGGANWNCSNHVNRDGQVPCRFNGYRLAAAQNADGLRAEPTLTLIGQDGTLAVAVPEFWQQFPKGLRVEDGRIHVELFPRNSGERFELQGGERKTHTFWISQCLTAKHEGLDWVHAPVRVTLSPEWVERCQVFPQFAPANFETSRPADVDVYLSEALSGPHSVTARREVIDEYGWRNFGEVWADHEQAGFSGPRPIISHYNNQFDLIFGGILHGARTGDPMWWDLFDPLARHVLDIDLYHTRRDRAAYSGGMFWHTDHFQDARTATHRTYSRRNRPDGRDYGGGPSNEHCYTSGLLYHHFLTGCPDSWDAVVSLAEWIIAMDDGRRTVLGLIDSGPTGLASQTRESSYHGPGRGAGNAVNALLDAWQLTGAARFLDYAEVLIRRCIHPHDDPDTLDLLDAERRWSYVVFLTTLAKYLDLKREHARFDEAFHYARAALVRFALWMLNYERPWLDQPECLEYPNETWAAQELRKANVLRLAAAYVGDEELRGRLVRRGDELADRAWRDLAAFENRYVARCVSVVMTEGARDAALRRPQPTCDVPESFGPFPERVPFVPQRERIRRRLRNILQCGGMSPFSLGMQWMHKLGKRIKCLSRRASSTSP